jgi:EpsI family protein
MDLRRLLIGSAVGGAVLFAHGKPLAAMVEKWSQSPMYSYAFTVPFISLYLLWSRREALRRLAPQPSVLLGGLIIAGGLSLLLAGGLAGIQVVQQISFLVSLVGVVLALFGTAYVRVAWAALAYLVLMFPIWDPLTESLHWRFQNQSASLGVGLLQAGGIPVHRDATTIFLPNVTLEVARSCSGVNYLVAVLALGLPLSYLSLPTVWRRVVLVGSAIAIAALSNGLRVALIGALAYYELGSPLHGPMHVLHGLFVAGIGYVALFAGLRLLSTPAAAEDDARTPATPAGRAWAFATKPAAAVAALFLAVGAMSYLGNTPSVALTSDLGTLPTQLGAWSGRALSPSADGQAGLRADTDAQIRRRYAKAGGTAIDVYVGYFGAQQQSRELAGFRMADWHRAASPVRVPLPAGGDLAANLVPAGAQGPLTVFWYEVDGAVETSSYAVKARTAWNAVVRRRSNGAVIMLSVAPGRQAAKADELVPELMELAGLMYEALGQQLPRPSASRSERRTAGSMGMRPMVADRGSKVSAS